MIGQRTAETAPRESVARQSAPRLIGDYKLTEMLRRYPRADAFEAIHRPSATVRVLYVVRPAAMRDRAFMREVVSEAGAACRVSHPSVPVFDAYGETPDRRLYLAVRQPPGATLAATVAARGKLDVKLIAGIASHIVDALGEAHAIGLVHGRLTPDSIVLGQSEEGDCYEVSLTGLGTRELTAGELDPADLPYASPEQVAGATVDARADVFSLASVLQFALDGVAPRPQSDVHEGHGRYSAARVMARARAADPAARYASIQAFRSELLAALTWDTSFGPGDAWSDVLREEPSTPALDDPAEAELALAMTNLAVAIPTSPASGDPSPEDESRATDIRWDDFAPASVAIAERPQPKRTRRLGRRAALGLAAAGLVGVTGLAAALGRPSARPRIVVASRGALSADARDIAGTSNATPVPSAPVTTAPVTSAPPTFASAPEAPLTDSVTPLPDVKRDVAASGSAATRPAVALPTIPRVDAVAIPTVNVAPRPTVRGDIVRADEFVPVARRETAESRAARPESSDAAPIDAAGARREAERAVRAFASALGARDVDALNRAAPDMPASARAHWAGVFRDAIRVRADLTVLDVQLDGGAIAARVRSRIEVYHAGAAKPDRVDALSMAVLEHDSAGWHLTTAP